MSKIVIGEFRRQPMRSWKTDDDHSEMTCYLDMEGRVTLSDLLDHFAENYPHVNTMDLQFNFATVVWDEPATPDDLSRRQEYRAKRAARTEHWERETLSRLKAKYENLT